MQRLIHHLGFAAGGAALALLAPASIYATTWNVPGDFPTIQEGIDASVAGDSVLVGPGTWYGTNRSLQVCANFLNKHSVLFLKPGVSVISTAGPDVTVLDGGPETSPTVETVLLSTVDGPATLVQGFTITGGGEGVSIGCTDSHVRLVDCRIVDNGSVGMDVSAAMVTLEDCVVSGNQGETSFGAVNVSFEGEIEVFNTRFENNSPAAMSLINPSRVLIDGCEFVDHGWKGAITIGSCPDATVRNSLFLNNRTTGTNISGAALLITQSSVVIEFNVFAYDSALAAHGGAIFVTAGTSVTIENNTFYGCYTPGFGSAIGISLSNATVHGNIAVNNLGAAFAQFGGSTLNSLGSGCNLLWDNTASPLGDPGEGDYYDWDPLASVSDIYVDPLFCDPEQLDFTVGSESPAAVENSGACGQIGALGVGCGAVGVDEPHIVPTTWGRLKDKFRN